MSFCGAITLFMALHAGSGTSSMRQVFPGVYADLQAKVVEFEGRITPMLVKDDRAPLFFLEVLVCSPDTREHETLVVSKVKPSHIHAALLLIDLKPGTPGRWTIENNQLTPVQPTGDRVSLRFVYMDKTGARIEADPLDWVVSNRDKQRFMDSENAAAQTNKSPPPHWLFAGSKFVKRPGPDGLVREVYDADGSGTIVGLTTFGSELIGWSRIISPDASVEEPQWVADFSKTPPPDTAVRVRIRAAP